MRAASMDLDLEVFQGPFDLLLTLVLKEEVDLLEVDLAEIVLAYLEHLERAGELDLEATTEFLVLIAALLELKSRLMLPREDEDAALDWEPEEAAEELLARMLEYRRYRKAAAFLAERLAAESGFRYRNAPLPPDLRRVSVAVAEAAYDPMSLGRAIGGLLRHPPRVDVTHMGQVRVSVADRLQALRGLLRRGTTTFDEAVRGADRVTVCITLFALLEMYKQGEATWDQDEPFGEIVIAAREVEEPAAVGAAS